MITKERLEELIEKGATIWYLSRNNDNNERTIIKEISLENCKAIIRDFSNKQNVFIGIEVILKSKKFVVDRNEFDYLFETKEEAEWHKEFGCIERTERLELPTWEEVSRDLKNVPAGNYVIAEVDDLSIEYVKYNNDFIVYEDKFSELEVEATKEGYIKACRKAKELFLGEGK